MYYSMRYLLDIEGAGESEGTFYRIHWGRFVLRSSRSGFKTN